MYGTINLSSATEWQDYLEISFTSEYPAPQTSLMGIDYPDLIRYRNFLPDYWVTYPQPPFY